MGDRILSRRVHRVGYLEGNNSVDRDESINGGDEPRRVPNGYDDADKIKSLRAAWGKQRFQLTN